MEYDGLDAFLNGGAAALAKGPVALIMVEDLVEVESTIRHHVASGFREVVVFAPPELALPQALRDTVHLVRQELRAVQGVTETVNRLIEAAPGTWFYQCYNAEYLFFPFCESRRIGEMLAFHAEERRDAVLAYVVDLYAGDLERTPDAVSLEHPYLDRSGYYAATRAGPDGNPKERQLDFFGGLRWRFEEHVPPAKRKIDRIALFKAKPGLEMVEGHRFNIEEYNTYACPWHHNITVAICSFRTAKALKSNPGSSFDIPAFRWHNSVPFEWHSQQLLDLGLMEPGQWF